jgi:tetratricopeptide (TPR) repeat protein/O-antigen ligase
MPERRRKRVRLPNHPAKNPGWYNDIPKFARYLGEFMALIIAAGSPWLFACNEPAFEFLLTLCAMLLVGFWAIHAATTKSFQFRPDVVSVALAGLVLWSGFQLIPLPEFLVGIISPTRLNLHRDLVPAVTESIPGGGGGVARASLIPLTLDPAATTTFLARCLGLLMIYAAVRNWLATRDSVRRFSVPFVAVGAFMAFISILTSASPARGIMLWSFEVDSDSTFGPFICRNHYADYLYFSLGLVFIYFFVKAPETSERSYKGKSWITPLGIIVAFVVLLMLLSLFMSLSRGGVISAFFAAIGTLIVTRFRRGEGSESVPVVKIVLGALVLVVGMVGFWMASDVVVKRAASLKSESALETRIPLWQDAVRLIPMTWTTGSGAGTFVHVETITRDPSRDRGFFFVDSAHNEYLEAIIEGGIPRLLLTLMLAIGPLVVLGRGFLERRERSIGPTILAIWFAMLALAIHAFVDFGLHMPAVAATTAVLLGFGMAAAVDTNFVPVRQKVQRVQSGDAVLSDVTNAPLEVAAEPRDPMWKIRGLAAMAVSLAACVPMFGVLWHSRTRAQAAVLEVEAENAAFYFSKTRFEDRARLYEQRAALTPNDPDALLNAGEARLEAAIYRTWTQSGAVLGGPLAYLSPGRPNIGALPEDYRAAISWFQQARAINPATPKAHTRLATIARFLPDSTAKEHFRRAKRLLPADADLWYASGREAYTRQDFTAAHADWRQSLSISVRHAPEIIAACRDRLSTDQLIRTVIPEDPRILLACMNGLYPDRARQAGERKKFLDSILAVTENRKDLTPENQITLAETYDELERIEEADTVFLSALGEEPSHHGLRRRYAEFLIRNDRPREALQHLDWLRLHENRNTEVQDRIDAARHAARLLEEIEKVGD